MLESLTLTAFKAYSEPTTVPLHPFSMLVGPNGTGKSTALQAIDLLGALVKSTLPEYLKENGWDYGDLVHLRSANSEIRIAARVRLERELYEWTVTLGKRRRAGIARERVVVDPGGSQIVLLERNGRKMSRLVEGASGNATEEIVQTLTSSWLSTLEQPDEKRFPRLWRLAWWARRIRGHFFLDPLKLRAPDRGDHDSIGPHGEKLAPFLAGLRKHDAKSFRQLIDRVKDHYPRLETIEPRRTKYGWTHLEIEERWNGERAVLNANQASDGLLRLIAVAAMYAAEPPTSVLLLDEIENGMHPHLLGHFIEMLQVLSEKTQVIVTTHSPVAVSFVRRPEGVTIVDRGKGGSPKCISLTNAKGYGRLSENFDPGELWYNLGEEKLVR